MTWLKVLESRACSAEAKPAALRFPPNVVGRKTVIHGQGLFKSPIRDRCQRYALGCRVIHVHVQVLAIAYLVHATLTPSSRLALATISILSGVIWQSTSRKHSIEFLTLAILSLMERDTLVVV